MGWNNGRMTGAAWMGMGLFWLVLLGLIIWLVIRLLPGRSHEPHSATPAATSPTVSAIAPAAVPALAILDERLASGEVDVETYRTIRTTILEGRGGKR